LSCQLSRAQEEQCIADEDSDDRAQKVPRDTILNLGVRPLSPPAFPSMGKIILLTLSKTDGQLKPRRGYVITPTPFPTLIADFPLAEEDELLDSLSDSSTNLGWSSEQSEYPAPLMELLINLSGAYSHHRSNPLPEGVFDPNQFCTTTSKRLSRLPFEEGYFDGTGSCFKMSGDYGTTYFQPPFEFNPDYHLFLPEGQVPSPYIEAAIFHVSILYLALKRYLEQTCDQDGLPRSEMLMRYPPSIYVRRTAAYELHVLRL